MYIKNERMGTTPLKYIKVVTIIFIIIIVVIGTIKFIITGPHGINIITSLYYAPPGEGSHYLYFEISNRPLLRNIYIDSICFEKVKKFKIKRLKLLQAIEIGPNSFTLHKDSFGDDESKSFHILDCESLESIQIGEYSFSDFGGEFELKNLPKLKSIRIGRIGSRSHNFLYSSFVIQGIELILDIILIRSSKSTVNYVR